MDLKKEVIKAISKVIGEEIAPVLEIPPNQELGDYALPCFAFSKKFKKSPQEIAKDIASQLQKNKDFEKIEAVGPYVNFFLDRKKVAVEIVKRIEEGKDAYGGNAAGKGKKFMVEFSQPNTHKAFHVGHIRGTSLGESIARIKQFSGNKVIRANYSGDTGKHVAKWLWCYQKFHSKEKPKEDESWFAGIYTEAVQKLTDNEEGGQEVEEINRKLDAGKDKTLTQLWKETKKMSIDAWKPIYKDLDVHFDVAYFESEVEQPGKAIAQELLRKKIAKMSDGAVIMDFKEIGLGVWVLLRKDGTVLYSAKDLALAEIKLQQYKCDKSLVITAAEQNLHFQQLQKTLELMNFSLWSEYHHKGYESVRFPWGKMSSRTGDNVLYAHFRDELIKEARREIAAREEINEKELHTRSLAIAIAAMKYTMLKQDMHKNIIFNQKEAIRFEGDTGPYLLYSYARAKSILRKAGKKQKKTILSSISEQEKKLIKALGGFPEAVERACEQIAPNLIANYAYELAQIFNEFYHTSPVIGSEEEGWRVKLVASFAQVMRNALYLLGIPIIEKM